MSRRKEAKNVIGFGLKDICSHFFKYPFNAKMAEAVFSSHLFSRGACLTSRPGHRLLWGFFVVLSIPCRQML